jgi:thiosulfate/3-mercaptopyruvate sulfurtransferase
MYKTLISSADLAARLDDPAFVVVDVRHDLMQPDAWGESEYRKAHLPGAGFAHMDRDLSAPKTGKNGRHPLPAPETAAALFGRLGIGADTQVVAYDQHAGMYAARLWWMLRWLGHDTVAVLDGGFDKWTRENHPTSTSVAPRAPREFPIRRVMATVGVQDILDSLPTRSRFMIDARAAERFRGETEPIDPVAGHIPGAHSHPYAKNLNADQTFRSPAALRAAFSELLGPTSPQRVVHMCGSGVTSCHNVLAMEIAGYGTTTIYPGSWSEWCADPARPVATGPA